MTQQGLHVTQQGESSMQEGGGGGGGGGGGRLPVFTIAALAVYLVGNFFPLSVVMCTW